MLSAGLFPDYITWSSAAGFAGNVFAFMLYLSPLPTFQRIIRHGSTEQFSGMPYVYGLLNCLLCVWYGMPFVKSGIILVATVNFVGAVFQLAYLSIFISYAERTVKLLMLGLGGGVFVAFALVVFVSLRFMEGDLRQMFVGYLSVASVISMYASPLFVIKVVIKTKSVEYMPFNISFATFLVSLSFCVYGLLQGDPFVYIPNGIGTFLGIIQLALYTYYNNASEDDEEDEESSEQQPLLDSYAP